MIAMYMRVSQEERDANAFGDGWSTSIDGQRILLSEHIRSMRAKGSLSSWEADYVESFVDDGYSGMNISRPGLEQLLDACSEGHVDCVIVNDLSRLSRSYIDLGDLVDRAFPKYGVRFVSRAEGLDLPGIRAFGFDNDRCVFEAESDLMRNIIAICNNTYSLQISRNVKASMHASWAHGEHVQAFAPFGYFYDSGARGHLRIDPVAAEWVRLIFELAAEGHTAEEIANELRKRGVPTPAEYAKQTGGPKAGCYGGEMTPWNARKVRYILGREVYAGVLVGGTTRSVGVGKGCGKRATEPWEQVRVEDAHEPIVSRELFEAAS